LSDKEIVLTAEGLQKLQEELDDLKTVHRREVNDRIRQAKEFGDLSENAEYEDAKQEQAFVEGRVLKIEAMLRNARIIDSSEYAEDEVHLGAEVHLKDEDGNAFTFTIVGSTESDPPNHRLSNESPLGKSLIGRKVGEMVDVKTPRGNTQYTIESISSTKRPAKR
jgi:transcription elongation factor GreA